MNEESLAALLAAPEVLALGQPAEVFLESQEPAWVLQNLRPLLGQPVEPEQGVVVILAGAGMLVIAVVAAIVLKFSGVSVLFLSMMVCLLAYGVWLYLDSVHARRPLKPEELVAVAICPAGLGYCRAGAWTALRWDDVAEVEAILPAVIRVKAQDGRKIILEGYRFKEPAKDLGKIERLAYAPILDRAAVAVKAGQTVSFGPLGIDKRGVSYQGKFLAWDQIGRLELQPPLGQGALTMQLRIGEIGKNYGGLISEGDWWFKEPFVSIPNHAVLLTLLVTHRPQGVPVAISPALGVVMPWYQIK